MIVIFGSLDSSLEQAQRKGNLAAIVDDYSLFRSFDEVVLVTQDTKDFSEQLNGIIHVPCSISKARTITKILAYMSILRWANFSLRSFFWSTRNLKNIKAIVSENVDSPTPLFVSTVFRLPLYIRYNYDVATQVKSVNKESFLGTVILFLEKLAFKQASSIWVMSRTLEEKALSFGAKKVKLIPNWANSNVTQAHNPLNYETGAFEVLFVGRLHPVKRTNLLIEAFSLFNKDFPEAKLRIIGDGVERTNLENLVKKLSLSKNVFFMGFQDHKKVMEIMSQSDIIVMPSLMEGNPRVLIEAMMAGLPIVATNVPGISDMVEHGMTGYLVEEATPVNLCKGIFSVLSNKAYALKISENARNFALQEFSKEKIAQKINDDLVCK